MECLQVTTGAVTGSPLALTASFEATLAFYVWHTAKQEHYPGLMAALAKAWQTDMRSQYGRVRQVFRQKTSPDKANEETQAVFSCMVVANRATVLSEPLRPVLIHSPDLTPEDAIRHMLDQLLLVARQISQPQDTVSPEQRLQGDAQQQPADAAEEDVPSDPHIEILHGILILLKLALLAGCVPALLADRNTAKARGCLWLAIDGLCKQLKEHDKAQVAAAAAAARSAATQSAIVTATAHAEADVKMQTVEDLSQLLARQVLMALETAMGQSGRPAEIMCNLLSALMTRSSKRVYEAVAAEIFEQGEYRHPHLGICCCIKLIALACLSVVQSSLMRIPRCCSCK